MPKVDIDQVMDECVSIQNQINGLNLLLVNKKQTLAKYFEATGKRQISNDDCVISVQERTTVDYDIDALSEKLPDEILSKIIEKRYEIVDWDKFVKFLKTHGISGSQVRPHISVTKAINKENLSALYERKKLSIKDIEGCYTAKITKSVVLRLKNAKQEINIT